ncbi:MAG: hypothetical protein HPY45_02020 [Anaerolineae bacterium]|nr:hypothetical protein [Anaerolineae bacterium]
MNSRQTFWLLVMYLCVVFLLAEFVLQVLVVMDVAPILGLLLVFAWAVFLYLVMRFLRVVREGSGFEKVKKVVIYSIPLQFLVILILAALGYVTAMGWGDQAGGQALDKRLFEITLFMVQIASLILALIVAYSVAIGLLDRVRSPDSKNALAPVLFMLGAIIFAVVSFTPYYLLDANRLWLWENLGGMKFFWINYGVYAVLSVHAAIWFHKNLGIRLVARNIGRDH